jgi:hypothetical protein
MAKVPTYTIRIKGHLSPRWSEWFDGMSIIHQANGQTLLVGPVDDQAALYGLLLKLRDLGLPLLGLDCSQSQGSSALLEE